MKDLPKPVEVYWFDYYLIKLVHWFAKKINIISGYKIWPKGEVPEIK